MAQCLRINCSNICNWNSIRSFDICFTALVRLPSFTCSIGMKERLLGDSAFLAKVAIEVGMGMVTKIIAELEQREEKFLVELYLVIANVFMSLITDIMLLWIPAPRANLSTPALGVLEQQKQSPTLQPCYQFWATCPANAFQVSPIGEPFTMLKRLGSFFKNGALLLAVGFLSSVLGVVITNVLLLIRNMLNQNMGADATAQQVWGISIAHGIWMATSGNLRYQVVGGLLEDRCFNTIFARQQTISGALSFVTRTINTYFGSLWWVDFLRCLGLQET
ncbi:hypothetical protein ABBQ38_000795 [Trebouxia sp. C0009 RCD-2024]